MSVNLCMRMNACLYISVCIWICVYICVYVCVGMWACIQTKKHTKKKQRERGKKVIKIVEAHACNPRVEETEAER